jgi:hypothetical protein
MGPRSSLSSRLFTYEKKYNGTGIKDKQFLYSLADPGYLSRIPNPGSKRFPDPGSASASKNLIILTQKFFAKISEICSLFIPDPDLDFLPNPDSGVKKARSATLILDIT